MCCLGLVREVKEMKIHIKTLITLNWLLWLWRLAKKVSSTQWGVPPKVICWNPQDNDGFWRWLGPDWGFPGGTSGKEPACQSRRHKRHGFYPWVGKNPWRRAWQPTPVFLPGESHGQRSLVGHSPWGVSMELDTTKVTYDGRESQWTLRVGDGQGGLACCDSWGRKESDTTERLIWSESDLAHTHACRSC